MSKPVTHKEKMELFKVLLHPANSCIKVNEGRDRKIVNAIKKDVLLVKRSFYPMNPVVAKWKSNGKTNIFAKKNKSR